VEAVTGIAVGVSVRVWVGTGEGVLVGVVPWESIPSGLPGNESVAAATQDPLTRRKSLRETRKLRPCFFRSKISGCWLVFFSALVPIEKTPSSYILAHIFMNAAASCAFNVYVTGSFFNRLRAAARHPQTSLCRAIRRYCIRKPCHCRIEN
jgi:hypothetical protein